MILSPFNPMGLAFIINTNGTPSTTQSTKVDLTTLGLPTSGIPAQIRIRNTDATNVVWLSFTAAGAAVIVPVAGTTTTGTPNAGTWIAAASERVFTLPVTSTIANGFFINTIGAGTSSPLWCQLGEGI